MTLDFAKINGIVTMTRACADGGTITIRAVTVADLVPAIEGLLRAGTAGDSNTNTQPAARI